MIYADDSDNGRGKKKLYYKVKVTSLYYLLLKLKVLNLLKELKMFKSSKCKIKIQKSKKRTLFALNVQLHIPET